VPAATAEAFAAIYDVTDEEREALRRYVADWSKNSTLLPIKDKEGNFKYIDFSHANAYDTLVRPIQTILNSIADGRTDEDGLMNDFIAGMFGSMSEFAQPFISESIWFSGI
jgi:DNA invertase Pin-like site-specific DNA recombinase